MSTPKKSYIKLLREFRGLDEAQPAVDQKKLNKIFDTLKKNDKIEIKYGSAMASSGDKHSTLVVTSGKRTVGKRGVERVIFKHEKNPRGVKYFLYRRDGQVSFAIGDMGATLTDIKESVELDEAWNADSVTRNAEIGSKKGYGINIKKRGAVTKTPYKHMLMTKSTGKKIKVRFDFGKDEFVGTADEVASHLNNILGIKEGSAIRGALYFDSSIKSDEAGFIRHLMARKMAIASRRKGRVEVVMTKDNTDRIMKAAKKYGMIPER
mgnify:CR=1 FL=1